MDWIDFWNGRMYRLDKLVEWMEWQDGWIG